jgi:CRISPR-associated protein Cas5h
MATVFEAFGPIAMFRRPYTTTSSVSYPIPTPTALAGLIAAIVGFSNGGAENAGSANYWKLLQGTQLAIRLLAPLKWRTETVNYWNVKNAVKSPHIQVKHQFIHKPHYRIYVHGGVEEELYNHLINETFVYTPYLGVAYALAEVRYCGRYAWEPVNSDETVNVATVIPFIDELEIDVVNSQEVFRERIPYRLSEERALLKTLPILYQTDPQKRLRLVKWGNFNVTRCGEDVVTWFPSW